MGLLNINYRAIKQNIVFLEGGQVHQIGECQARSPLLKCNQINEHENWFTDWDRHFLFYLHSIFTLSRSSKIDHKFSFRIQITNYTLNEFHSNLRWKLKYVFNFQLKSWFRAIHFKFGSHLYYTLLLNATISVGWMMHTQHTVHGRKLKNKKKLSEERNEFYRNMNGLNRFNSQFTFHLLNPKASTCYSLVIRFNDTIRKMCLLSETGANSICNHQFAANNQIRVFHFDWIMWIPSNAAKWKL